MYFIYESMVLDFGFLQGYKNILCHKNRLYQSKSYLQGKICLRVHQIGCNLLVLEHHHSAALDEAADPLRGWFLINQ